MQTPERKNLKAQYGAVYDDFAEILFRLDPQGINFEINPDEYDAEVSTILPRVINARSPEEIIPVLREELFKWFGSGVVNPRTTYEELAEELWRALQRRRNPPAN